VHDTDPQDDAARARLDILRHTNDGFQTAEEDLRLRGAGDLLGLRQSGEGDYRVADVSRHAHLLVLATGQAASVRSPIPHVFQRLEAAAAIFRA
jgi:ATP-dependent DNA helicase RecG